MPRKRHDEGEDPADSLASEGAGDLAPFDPESFARGLVS